MALELFKDRQLLVGAFCAALPFSLFTSFAFTYYTLNESELFSLSNNIFSIIFKGSSKKQHVKNLFYHFYFLNKDISQIQVRARVMKFQTSVKNIDMEGTVSQALFRSSFLFYLKKQVIFLGNIM